MSRFQERLWDELVCDHATALAYPAGSRDLLPGLTIVEPRGTALGTGALRPGRLLRRPRRLVAGLVALAAVVATVSILTTTGTTPSAAYAVTQKPDGALDISINELTGVVGANAQLAKLGVSVRVVPVQAGCTAAGAIAPMAPSLAATVAHIEGEGVTVQPGLVPPGDTLVLAAKQIGAIVGLGYKLYRGTAPACLPPGDSHAG
ncbi:MAG TPA: hypothetical protein VHS55_04375 [Solirubrobacteraceae bacterium]|jgi:hypothetical protein|nr:hypothetical protein [Solirubrobacteraceae bacterium]